MQAWLDEEMLTAGVKLTVVDEQHHKRVRPLPAHWRLDWVAACKPFTVNTVARQLGATKNTRWRWSASNGGNFA